MKGEQHCFYRVSRVIVGRRQGDGEVRSLKSFCQPEQSGTALRSFWEFAVHSGCTVKSVLGLAWLSPTPTMAISEMPTVESPEPREA
jgi:hypothetical protein